MAEHNDFGRHCEQLASEYLSRNGYNILETNWRIRHLEIDIIAQKDNTLVIVEVRSRNANTPIEPEDTISYSKIKHIVNAASSYVKIYNINLDVRFDVITLLYNSCTRTYTLKHTIDAFFPPVN